MHVAGTTVPAMSRPKQFEHHRYMGDKRTQRVYDLDNVTDQDAVDEAVVWIADRLPDEVTAQHSHAEVRQLLLWSVEHLRALATEDRVAEEEETFGYVVDRVADTGLDWEPLEVKWVLDLQAQYLELIGAAGRQDMPPEMPPEADT